MNIEHILGRDTFGIVFDMISDDLNFVLYLKQERIKPKGKDINFDNFNWDEISHNKNLSFEFIEEFKNQLNWSILTSNNINEIDFIRTFKDNIDWYTISNRLSFDNCGYEYDFFEEFSSYINWSKIARWDYISEDFIDKFSEVLDWDVISGCQGLSRYLMEKYIDNINWNRIINNRSIARDLVEEFRPPLEETDEDNDIELNNNNDPLIVEQVDEDIVYGPLPNRDIDEEESSEDDDIQLIIA